ncbi:UNVERIFIED_CONTAM: hypothetical protein Sradi_1405700 [Sesamum radiatum]|uniref:MULE transposase domain-containing protein n=1 Tax=Sesamum radiatum TaxID=300843 RepID=A0AAW2USQ4_SESRA
MKKLKRVLKAKKNRKIPETRGIGTKFGEHEWASEAENENDLVSLEGSEGSDTEKHPVYKESASMKNLNLVVGMKFENAAQFRVVLRDWCIRNGIDLEFLRNEAKRVTAKCKVQVRKCNPGSKLLLRKLENSDPPIFDRMYFSLWALKKGFLEGCRPIIGLDGCFLKTVYGGQLLVAVGRDGNDNMFPIAMAVVQTENRDTWGWFLGELLDDIGGVGTGKWSFISDRQKGLVEALKDLVPESEHRFCLRHMYENFKVKFKSVELKEYFWKAASTANRREFDFFMKKIEELDPKMKDEVETASEWLKRINPQHWARSYFPIHSKCDILVNNLCESFNNYILEARDKPIIRYPCCHTCAAIGCKRAKLEDYVDDYFKKIVYLKVYSDMIHAVPGVKDYIKTSFEPFKPPKIKKKRGRPKKLRRKGPSELESKRSTRKGLTHVCSKCLQVGHNKGSCKNQLHPKSKIFKERNAPESEHQEIPQGSQAPPLSQEQPSGVETAPTGTRRSTLQQHAPTTATQEQVGYFGPRNAALLRNAGSASTQTTSSIPANRRYNKKPTIDQVLKKMKERSKRRQED